MKTNLTTEQQAVFNKYFETHGDQHIAKNDIHFSVAFFDLDFELYRDTDVVLEIKVGHTCIAMWKKVKHLHITIL